MLSECVWKNLCSNRSLFFFFFMSVNFSKIKYLFTDDCKYSNILPLCTKPLSPVPWKDRKLLRSIMFLILNIRICIIKYTVVCHGSKWDSVIPMARQFFTLSSLAQSYYGHMFTVAWKRGIHKEEELEPSGKLKKILPSSNILLLSQTLTCCHSVCFFDS